MTTRPTVSPAFATDATFGTGVDAAQPPRLDPGAGIRARGYLGAARAAARWFNFQLGLLGDWLQYLDEKNTWLFNPKNFGAVADGVADDTAAIQAALNACSAAGGGKVVCGAGTYRLVALLDMPVDVSLAARGNVTFLKDHASSGTLSWSTGTDAGCGVTVEDIHFEAAQNNTGAVLSVSVAVAVTVKRCSINNSADLKLLGQILLSTSAGARVRFHDCQCRLIATVAVGISGLGEVELVGGSYSVPGAYAGSSFIAVTTVRCYRAKFTQLLSTVGGFAFIYGAFATVEGCVFRVTDSGASDLTYACEVNTGSVLMSSNNDFGNDTDGYCYPCKGTGAARGSVIQLLPVVRQTPAGSSVAVLAGHASAFIASTNTGGTDLELPIGFCPGQLLALTYFNNTASAIEFEFVTTPITGTATPTIGAGNTQTAWFVWDDRDGAGSYRWIQIGDWSVGATLVA